MTYSDTYNFQPSTGGLVLQAFHMCGIRPTELIQEHLTSAQIAANLLLGRWSSQTPNLWSVDLQTVPLVTGQATYDVPANTVVITDAYVTVQSGSSAIDRILSPISRSEYAAYTNKDQQGSVTVYWLDRTLSPTVTLYYVPDGTQSTLNYYRVRQSMDANYTSGQNVEMPYYFLEAFVTGLAFRLAVMWAPDKATGLKLLADESYGIAIDQNVETANFYISPSIQGYFQS